MLQKLRDQTQSLAFKVLVGAIIFVLAIFGFGAFNLFIDTDPSIASVNGEDITQRMLLQETDRERRRLAGQFGENFNPDMIDPVLLQNSVISQLISRMLLAQAAEDLGIGASDKQVNEIVVQNPNFRIDGRFEESAYRRVVTMLGYSPSDFLALTGEMIGVDQLRSGIVDSAFNTDWELRHHARLLSQRRDIAYLEFNEEAFAETIEISEDDIALRYEENLLDFMTEESLDLAYVELTLDDLLFDDSIEMTEDDLIAAYESDKAAAVLSEQRDSRHILIAVDDDRSEDAAMAAIAELQSRLEGGEDFAELAREFSEDPGSASQGGELGAVGEGLFAPEFEAALWALEEGQLSEPVRTEFGIHLIQLNRVIANEFPSFEESRAQIETRIRRDQAIQLFVDRVRELDNIAFEQPDTLDGIADQLGLEIQTVGGISRSTGSGIFGNELLRQSVFTDEVLEQGYNSPAVEYLDNRAVVSRVVARHEPQAIALEEVAEQIREEIFTERARIEIETAQAAALARVEAGESVVEVAADAGLVWQTHELVRRNQPGLPPEVLSTAFNLPRPAENDKRVGSAEAVDGSRFVVTLTRVEDGDVSTMTETEIDGMRQFLASRASNLDFDGYFSALEQNASIERPN
jgi:peptidyl-prolyl cis-trans isomerase D